MDAIRKHIHGLTVFRYPLNGTTTVIINATANDTTTMVYINADDSGTVEYPPTWIFNHINPSNVIVNFIAATVLQGSIFYTPIIARFAKLSSPSGLSGSTVTAYSTMVVNSLDPNPTYYFSPFSNATNPNVLTCYQT